MELVSTSCMVADGLWAGAQQNNGGVDGIESELVHIKCLALYSVSHMAMYILGQGISLILSTRGLISSQLPCECDLRCPGSHRQLCPRQPAAAPAATWRCWVSRPARAGARCPEVKQAALRLP